MGGWRHRASDDEVDVLRQEVTMLREEAARLRLQEERTVGVRRAAARARAIADSEPLAELPQDDSWQCLVEARVARSELLFLCSEMRFALVFLERQLEALVPATELDRRTSDVGDNTIVDLRPPSSSDQLPLSPQDRRQSGYQATGQELDTPMPGAFIDEFFSHYNLNCKNR